MQVLPLPYFTFGLKHLYFNLLLATHFAKENRQNITVLVMPAVNAGAKRPLFSIFFFD